MAEGLEVPGWYGNGHQPPSEDEALDWRRYVHAILRRKWIIAASVVVGLAGAMFAYRSVRPQYEAVGSIWLEGQGGGRGPGGGGGIDLSPIRISGLLESEAWIELLRSFSVLDPVVTQEQLYITSPPEHQAAFATFGLGERVAFGRYRLEVSEDGTTVSLYANRGGLVEAVSIGDPIGAPVGFEWTPAPGSLEAGAEIGFSLVPPRDAARWLSDRLLTRMDQEANFITLRLQDSDAERAASVLNAVMDRHVELADFLKRGRLEETRDILTEQLAAAESELEMAERELEEFRVRTITLPSDEATPIAPGLEATRDPVFERFFDMKVDLEALRRDRIRLTAVYDSLSETGVEVAVLDVIPRAAESIELRPLLEELVELRSQLRVYRDRYSDDYAPIQELLTRIGTIENVTIPSVLRSLLNEMEVQERQMETLVDSASAELAEIPARSIEEARLRRRVLVQEALYNELRERVETVRLAAASSIPDVRILDRAAVPLAPATDPRILWAFAVLVGCVGAAIGGAVLLDLLDSRLRYPTEVTHQIGLEILGGIPRIRPDGKRSNADQVAEAFRELRITVGFAHGTARPLVLTVTSPSQGEGKTLVCSNLAVAFADLGWRTLLIDGDVRRGDAHRLFGTSRRPGLADHLRNPAHDDVIQRTGYENLDFIGPGTPGVTTPELIASQHMASYLGTLKRAYHVIIIDSPPLAAGGDALVLGTLAGSMAIVIRTGSTDKQLALNKLDQLSKFPVRILGAILNDVEDSSGYRYYYASYLSGYEPIEDPEEVGSGLALKAGSEY